MAPQRAPGYSAPNGAQPVYGQQGAYSSLNQGLNVPVGIPAGVAAGYGPSAHSGNTIPAGAPPFHVGNGLPGSLHGPMGSMGGGNPQMGAFPGFPTQVAYPHFVQAQQQNSIIQPPPSNHGYENPAVLNIPGQWQGNPIRSPHSSCPPGFEPHHNNSIAMGIPTQTNLVNGATGTGAVNGNQHQVQQQHQNQVQHFQAHPPQQQVQSPSLHQQQQFQNLHLHQHHHNNNQRQHVLHHQSQNQHRQFQQEQNQHQKRYCQFNHRHRQRDVQHEYQQKHQDQHESNQQSYIQNGCQQKQQGQHERQHSWQLHSQSHVQSQAQPQFQLHSHHKPQCQPQSQSHLSCQQVQPSPAFQACITNGVALGVPVMPTHNSTNAISVKDSAQNQQHAPSWKHTIQSENSQINVKFLATNNIEQQKCSLANYSQEIPRMYAEESTNFHRDGALHSKDPSCEEVQSRSSSMANSHSGMEDMGPGNAVRNGHTKMKIMSGTNHHNFIDGESRKLQSPQKMQFHSGPSSRNRPNDRRNNQHRFNGQFKAHNKPFQVSRQNSHNHFGPQRQTLDSQGNSFSKGPGKRSDLCTFRCEPCDRTFTTSEFLSSHIKSHVKCGENGCSFEAAGKVVKEHRVVEHRKVDFQSTSRGRRALAMRLREDQEEIRRWREERKRSYPTSQNILRKAEAKRKREAEGESIDEESQLRRQVNFILY
ncbi:hypothetical protein KP509_10G029400 [Ceratopteris richardii]|uniref:C2H2-type domain-containing protein n=1 Tax=Ceratopteris richardii TaxID=49495 RepID=A0A8T2TZT5_CERRI|nr:hypothetical protein KP509_10G029400 [Ceratopteris richardii]